MCLYTVIHCEECTPISGAFIQALSKLQIRVPLVCTEGICGISIVHCECRGSQDREANRVASVCHSVSFVRHIDVRVQWAYLCVASAN